MIGNPGAPYTNSQMDTLQPTDHFTSNTDICYAIKEIAFSNLTRLETCTTNKEKNGSGPNLMLQRSRK